MRVNPVSKEEADAGGSGEPFKAGDYDFIIYAAEETLSKAGNEMLKLTLHIFNRDGEKRTVFDYILSSESGAWKARHMMEAVGMIREYERGEIDPHALGGKPGRCKIRVKPAAGDYPAQNAVVDYLAREGAAPARDPRVVSKMMDNYDRGTAAAARQKAPAGDLDDEIPF